MPSRSDSTVRGMPRRPRIPAELHDRVFTSAQASEHGVTSSMLRGRHFVPVHHGVWRLTTTEPSFELAVRAAALALPPGSAASHVTALQWMGVMIGSPSPVHFSTTSTAQTRNGVVLHRRLGRISALPRNGVAVLGPDRSFVDSGTLLSVRSLVQAGDWLVRAGHTTVDRLVDFTMASHLDGVVRAREAALLVRERVDSPRETDARLLIATAGLPEPEPNIDITTKAGEWVARGDLVLPAYRIVIEHDGWVHERNAEQRQKDHLRRERIEAAGWTLIVLTIADFVQPTSVVARIFEALLRRGYTGPPPELGRKWHQIARNL